MKWKTKGDVKYSKDDTKYDYSVYTEGGKILLGGGKLKDAKDCAERYSRRNKGKTITIRKKIYSVKGK